MSEQPSFVWANVQIQDHVATVTLNTTGKSKVSRQGPDFWREMPKLTAFLQASRDVRVVLLRGGGEGFSHGLDLMAMAPEMGGIINASGPESRTQLYELIQRMQQATSCLAQLSKPVVAAIHGWCVGAGIDIASACDIRVCAKDAKFSVREVKLAIVADVGSLARLPAIIGQGATRELAMTGDDIDASYAQQIGLVSRVYDTPEVLFAEAHKMAIRIAKNPPLVVSGIKRVLNLQSEREAEESLRQVAMWNAAFLPSADLNEAISAFVERREPTFKGD